MRLFAFIIFVSVMLLATCSAPGTTPLPVETDAPALPTSIEPASAPTEAAPNPKLPAASFESQTYLNEEAGFALDYPAGWTVNEVVIGSRGTQVQFLSSPEIADLATLPEGGTRVNATLYQWDPKNDLAAFIANQKTAWEASGFTILGEEQLVLELGLPAVRFTLQTPEANAVFLIAALDEQYLVLSGEGDLELVKEIVQRVRPVSVHQ
jgi:hypothetical protein